MKINSVLSTVLALLFIPAVTQAALVYEGFDYGDTGGAMSGKPVSSSSTGLTGSYLSTAGVGAATANYAPSGLSFSDNFLPTQGGALTLSLTVNPATTSSNEGIGIGVQLNAGTLTSTVFGSMLFNLSSATTELSGDAIQMRLSTAQTGGTVRMVMAGDSPNSANNVAVSYAGSTASQVFSTATTTLSTGTTYLMLGRWTNVGIAGGGAGTMWILTSTEYDSWLIGGATEAGLDTVAGIRVNQTTTSQTDFNNGMFLQFTIGEGGNAGVGGTLTGTFDEMRFDSSLAAVAVPEPGALSLLGLALVFLVRRTSRRRN